jgi:hypothetical protein
MITCYDRSERRRRTPWPHAVNDPVADVLQPADAGCEIALANAG